MIFDKHLDFKKALGSFPTGVTVVTTIDKNNNPMGFTANSFTSVSLDPHLILICIDNNSYNIEVFTGSKYFAINILAQAHQYISNTFANKVENRFDNINWSINNTHSPIIKDSVAWFDCLRHKTIKAGDHSIIIGKVLTFASTKKTHYYYCMVIILIFPLNKKSCVLLKSLV